MSQIAKPEPHIKINVLTTSDLERMKKEGIPASRPEDLLTALHLAQFGVECLIHQRSEEEDAIGVGKPGRVGDEFKSNPR